MSKQQPQKPKVTPPPETTVTTEVIPEQTTPQTGGEQVTTNTGTDGAPEPEVIVPVAEVETLRAYITKRYMPSGIVAPDVNYVINGLVNYGEKMARNYPQNQTTGSREQYELFNILNSAISSTANSHACIDAIVWAFAHDETGAFSLDYIHRWAPETFRNKTSYDMFNGLVSFFISFSKAQNRKQVIARTRLDTITKTMASQQMRDNFMRYINAVNI